MYNAHIKYICILIKFYFRNLLGKSMYKTASAMGVKMLHKVPQADFWEKSHFNQQCPSKIINFCEEGITRYLHML